MRNILFTLAVSAAISIAAPYAPQAQAQTRTLRFAVITDTHVGKPGAAAHLRAALESIAADDSIAFAVHAGDVAHDGTARGHRKARRLLRRLRRPLYVTTGNHDAKRPERLASFRRRFGSGRFLFEAGGFRIAGIPTGPYEAGRHATLAPEAAALLSRACGDTLPVIVIGHHTPDLIARAEKAMEEVDTTRIALWLAGHLHRNTTGPDGPGLCLTNAATLDEGRYNVIEIEGNDLRVVCVAPREGKRTVWLRKTLNLKKQPER